MIKLTTEGGCETFIMVRHISVFYRQAIGELTAIWFVGNAGSLIVRESPEQIVSMIEQAKVMGW